MWNISITGRSLLWGFLFFTLCLKTSDVFAEDYYWVPSYTSTLGTFSDPETGGRAVCAWAALPYSRLQFFSEGKFRVYCIQNGESSHGVMTRYGDSCPSGSDYDSATGKCVLAQDCSTVYPITSTSKSAIGCVSGCQFSQGVKIKNWNNALETLYQFNPTGQQCSGQPDLTNPSEFELAQNDNYCKEHNGSTLCTTSDDKCITVDGKLICEGSNDLGGLPQNCGWYNGTFVCMPVAESGCGSVNGELLCVAPGADEPIAATSPDHPVNGGNGDGNPSNDLLTQNDIDSNSEKAQTVNKSVTEYLTQNNIKNVHMGGEGGSSGSGGSLNLENPIESQTMEESATGYYAKMQEVPLIKSMSNLTPSNLQDNCPPLYFETEILGNFGTNAHCQLYEEQKGTVSVIMKGIWSIAGVLILLGA